MGKQIAIHRIAVAVCAAACFGTFVDSARAAEPAIVRAKQVIQSGLPDLHRPAVISGVSITPDGRTIAAATDDHCVLVCDVDKPADITRLTGHADWVRTVGLSPDGKMLASGGHDHSICLWDIGRREQVFQTAACDNAIAAVCFHPNSQQVAVVGFSRGMQIVNTSSGHTSQHLACPCGDVRTVVFSPDGARLAAAGRNGRVRIWNVADGSRERDIPTDRRRIRGLAFSPDGRQLAAAGTSADIRIFDVATGDELMKLETRPAKVHALLFLDQVTLATGGTDNRIWIWDLNTRQVTRRLEGHTGTVAALACDASGSILVSGSYDTTLRVWKLDEDATPEVARSQNQSVR